MFKTKLIYRLLSLLLVFALMILVPYTFTFVKQTQEIINLEESMQETESEEYREVHQKFVSMILENIIPYIIYTLVLAFMISIFFMRGMLSSLKRLQEGSQAISDGDLSTRLEVTSEDELGDVTRAFNDMAASLSEKTVELHKKDVYVNAMLDPLWVVNEENNITDINPAFTRLFGYSSEDVIGASVYDFLDEKNAIIMYNQLSDKREKGISSIYEINIITKDGSHLPVLISGSPIYSGDDIVGKIGILKDFREQSQLRDELKQSRDYLETVMDSIYDELIVIDKDYRIVQANRIARSTFIPPIVGEFCYRVAHGAKRPCWSEGYDCPSRTVFMTGESQTATHRHLSTTGVMKFHEIVASPIKDASGTVLYVIELMRDVTDRVEREHEISRKNIELMMLNNISDILSRSLRADQIFSNVLDRVLELINMESGGIYFVENGKKEMTCQYNRGISEEYLRNFGRVRLGDDLPGKVAATGQTVAIADLSQDARLEGSMLRHSGLKGYCCIPIRGKERIIGVFCLFSVKEHLFTAEEENILNSIGEMTGIALENIKLYERMSDLYEYQRRRMEDEHSHLLSLSEKLGSSIELEDIMTPVLNLLVKFFRADFGWLLANDEDGNFILKSATEYVGAENEVVYQHGISSLEGQCVKNGKPVMILDISAQENIYHFSGAITGKSFRSAIAVPLFIGKKAVGVYTLFYLATKKFRGEEVHFLEIIANVLAVAIQRSELYLQSISEKGLSDTVLHSVADAIVTVDTNGRVISLNKAFERITGFAVENAIGNMIDDIFRLDDKNSYLCTLIGECLNEALSGKSVVKLGEIVTTSMKKVAVQINTDPVIDKKGEVTGVVFLFRDISKEKEIDRMKTEIVRSVSHEFRTPLSAIVGMTEMIMEGDIEGDKARRYLSTILEEGIRLSKMVSELLSIARIESGKESLKLEPLDINTILKDVIDSFSALIGRKQAVVEFSLNIDGEFISDGEKLKELLINTLDNYLTFSDDGCSVKIEISKRNSDLEIVISDNGWGIPDEEIANLKERFFRGSHGEKIKGTGLGLSLCDEIVKVLGGRMEIKSKLGEGTQVILYIPYRGQNE
jgi:PAS domain S-box-containing protein